MFETNETEPCYVISVAARIIGVHAQTLRYYERAGLVSPSRSRGRIRLYSKRDIDKLRQIRTMLEDMGVNLAGVDVILRLNEHIMDMEKQMREMEHEVERLQQAGLGAASEGASNATG